MVKRVAIDMIEFMRVYIYSYLYIHYLYLNLQTKIICSTKHHIKNIYKYDELQAAVDLEVTTILLNHYFVV